MYMCYFPPYWETVALLKRGFSIYFCQLVPLCSIPTNERGGPWIYPQIEFKWNVEKWSTLCDLRHANCGKLNGQAKPQAAVAQELKREIQLLLLPLIFSRLTDECGLGCKWDACWSWGWDWAWSCCCWRCRLVRHVVDADVVEPNRVYKLDCP